MCGSKNNAAAKGKGKATGTLAPDVTPARQSTGSQLPTPFTGPSFPASPVPEPETPSVTRRSSRLSGKARVTYSLESEAGPSTQRGNYLDNFVPEEEESEDSDGDDEGAEAESDEDEDAKRTQSESHEEEEEDDDDDIFEGLDEYISVDIDVEVEEEEDEGGDDDSDDDEPVVQKVLRKRARLESEVSSRSNKKARPAPGLNAEDWVANYDQEHPVAEDDAWLLNFQKGISKLIGRNCQWARTGISPEWFKLPRENREMTCGFRSMLSRAPAAGMAGILFSGMPRQVQKVFGNPNVRAEDLLELPIIPPGLTYRGVYVDVATRIPEEHIVKKSSAFGCRAPVKALRNEAALRDILQAKAYLGSAVGRNGICGRVRTHEMESNKNQSKPYGHYGYTSQPDVLPNFRLVFVINQPDDEEGQDTQRWISVFFEGLLMTYLGMYIKENVPAELQDHLARIVPRASFELNEQLRQGFSFPSLGSVSLNIAWPLAQGASGGMVRAKCCGNPGCRKPLIHGQEKSEPGQPAVRKLRTLQGDILGGRYCTACLDAHNSNGAWRTREGYANGCFPQEIYVDGINDAWFAAGNPRKCYNDACGVEIPKGKLLYGFNSGIRCGRCDRFRRAYGEEWGMILDDGENDEGKDVAPGGRSTILRCASVGCMSPTSMFYRSFVNLIEDTDMGLWRCIPCDWAWPLYRLDVSEVMQQGDATKALPPGPISHHRHNCTHCVDCGNYATPREWTWVEGSGYKCDLCAGKRTISTIHLGLISTASGTKECKNPACNRTDANWDRWHYEESNSRDIDNVRCDRCHRWWTRTGEEWKEAERDFECANPLCDKNRENSEPSDLRKCSDGLTRCARCQSWWKRHSGTEWTPPLPRPDNCENPACGVGGYLTRNEDGRWSVCLGPLRQNGDNAPPLNATRPATTIISLSEGVRMISFDALGARSISEFTT
ncbi:hypothetical protein H9Q72_004865 [Fusarium xylarioides]|uniref:Uncharacterized protein n=1 Tax=Fusarium xylarioides TaxID=221167 RepID=A0A9P7I1C5_9HYPO|nr:hypothetical protein H9Q72_004865 [Fusarium xylarioides]